MIQRRFAGLLWIGNIAYGLLFPSSLGRAHAAGARDTGPFNPHLIQDIGPAFLASGFVPIGSGRPNHAMEDGVALVVIAPAAPAVHAALPSRGDQRDV